MVISLDKLRKFPEILDSEILNVQGKESKITGMVIRSHRELSRLLTFIRKISKLMT